MSREEEYFEPGSLNGADVKKFKKEEGDQSYEYFVAKDENNCVVGYAYVLKSAKGSIRLEKQCSNVKAIKKEEFLVKDELPEQDGSRNSSQESIRLEEIIVEQSEDELCSNEKTTQKEVVLDKNDPQEQDSNSNSDSEEETERDLIKKYKYKYKYPTYQCPYCDWGKKKEERIRHHQRLHVLFKHFSEDIFTALLTMLECTGGPCSLCGDSLPQRIGGWDKRDKKKEKEDYKMFFKQYNKPLLRHFATKHELTLTEGLMFSNNKLNQKNVDLLLDVLFPS